MRSWQKLAQDPFKEEAIKIEFLLIAMRYMLFLRHWPGSALSSFVFIHKLLTYTYPVRGKHVLANEKAGYAGTRGAPENDAGLCVYDRIWSAPYYGVWEVITESTCKVTWKVSGELFHPAIYGTILAVVLRREHGVEARYSNLELGCWISFQFFQLERNWQTNAAFFFVRVFCQSAHTSQKCCLKNC